MASWVRTERALDLVRRLAALGPRSGGTRRGNKAMHVVADELVEGGLSVEYVTHSTEEGSVLTVLGRMAGTGSPDGKVILLSAHGDADGGGPGADDNASGVAAIVEAARVLRQAGVAGLLPEKRPGVLVAVWGKEKFSAAEWIRTNPGESGRISAIFNVDQAGTGAGRDAVYYEGNSIPWNRDLLRLVEEVATAHAHRPGFWEEYTSTPFLGGTDADTFLPRSPGGRGMMSREVPVTTLFTSAWDRPRRMKQTPGWDSAGWPTPGEIVIDYSAFYHSENDTPGNTTEAEPHNLQRVTRLLALSVARWMSLQGDAGRLSEPGASTKDSP